LTPESLRQRMNSVGREDAARATFAVVDRLQRLPAHEQLVASAMVFWRMCQVSGVHPGDALAVCVNLFSDGVKPAPQFRATDAYLKSQVFGGM
jgi:hypothetical protein